MKDSTRRALRTVYQGLLSLLLVIPIVVLILQDSIPDTGERWGIVSSVLGGTVAVVGVVTKIVNALEAARLIPPWLKEPAATAVDPDPVDDEPGKHAADTMRPEGQLSFGMVDRPEDRA